MQQLCLSDDERQQWREHGFFTRAAQFDEAELAALRDAVEQAAQRAAAATRAAHSRTYFLDRKRFVDVDQATVQFEHNPGSETVRVLEPVHLFDARVDALVDDVRLTLPMQSLVRCDTLALWTTKLNLKSAAGSGFGWHQDSPYWMHDCPHVEQLPNVMLALDPQCTDNGCFRIIRGSHKQGVLPGTADGSQLGGFYTNPRCFSLQDDVPMEVAAGTLIFFHAHTVHGSQPNTSEQARRALILTYQPGGYPTLKTGKVRAVCTAGSLGGGKVLV